MKLVIPKIVKKSFVVGQEDWKLFIYEDQKDLYQEEKFLEEISSISLQYTDEVIVLSHQYYGFPFLLKVDGPANKVYFAHLRLNKELFLKKILDDISGSEFEEHINQFIKFDRNSCISILEKRTKDYELIDFFKKNPAIDKVDKRAEDLVLKLDEEIDKTPKNLFEKASDSFLSLISEYESLRNYALKFIASLPSLSFKDNHYEVKRLFLEAVRRIKSNHEYKKYPLYLRAAIQFAHFDAKITPAKLLSWSIHFMVELMAKRFIAGVDIVDAQESLLELKKSGRDSSLDPLGELVISKKEADEYKDKVVEFIRGFDQIYKPGERNKAEILKAHVSIKVSALTHHFSSEDLEYTYQSIAPRLKEIFQEAKKHKVFINIDAEHFHIRDAVVEIVYSLLEKESDLRGVEIGFVLQAYLRDAFAHLKLIERLHERHDFRLPIRLVKGAYWDQETIEADAHHYNAPQFLNKVETDLHYKQLIYYFLGHKKIQLVLASHNLYDHAWAISLREEVFPNSMPIEHQCLHMTYEALSKSLNRLDHCVRNYIPIGNLLVGMAYLVRRIMENSSQVGVLSQMRSDIDVKKILNQTDHFKSLKSSGSWSWDKNTSDFTGDFINIPHLRTFLSHYKKPLEETLRYYQKNKIEAEFDSVQSAKDKFSTLKLTEWNKPESQKLRIEKMLSAAELLVKRRYLFASLIVLEAKKSIGEALADVDEAIDFINYYAREEERRLPIQGRKSLIIAPWNFPLAILCGMSVASLLRGHLTIMKPAEQTPFIGQKLYELLLEVGVPSESLVLIQGDGAEVASPIIDSEEIDLIVFTGSRSVGTHLYKELSYQSKTNLKRVIAEMGGKNALILSKNTDLDEALKGAMYSCYAHAGQKCSACSVVFIEKPIYQKFADRFAQASKDASVGEAFSFSTQINPLVTREEKVRVLEIREKLKRKIKEYKGEILVDELDQEGESLVGPFVYQVSAKAYREESLFRQEFFAPIIVLVKVDDLDMAIELNNSSDYALTCGIYSQSDDDINYALDKLENGNIYVNRSCTGARVGIEPFGGFKFSGTGPKAGGGSYLDAFDISSEELSPYSTVKIPGQNNYIDQRLEFSKVAYIVESKNFFEKNHNKNDSRIILDGESQINLSEDIEVLYFENMNVFNKVKNKDIFTYKKGLRKFYLMESNKERLSMERLVAINTMRYGAPIAENS